MSDFIKIHIAVTNNHTTINMIDPFIPVNVIKHIERGMREMVSRVSTG